ISSHGEICRRTPSSHLVSPVLLQSTFLRKIVPFRCLETRSTPPATPFCLSPTALAIPTAHLLLSMHSRRELALLRVHWMAFPPELQPLPTRRALALFSSSKRRRFNR